MRKHLQLAKYVDRNFWNVCFIVLFLIFQMHNISDPTEIIFEMTKDDRKQFYRTIARGLQRPLFSVYRRVTRMYDQKNHIGKYSYEEKIKLKE